MAPVSLKSVAGIAIFDRVGNWVKNQGKWVKLTRLELEDNLNVVVLALGEGELATELALVWASELGCVWA